MTVETIIIVNMFLFKRLIIVITVAPKTFLMLISFIRFKMFIDINPNNPMHDITIATPAINENNNVIASKPLK